MTRKLSPLLLVVGVLWAAPASAQTSSRTPRTPNSESKEGAVQAEIFMSAFQEIFRRHVGAFSDSTLWAMALQGLVESLDDPYAAVFTPSEVEQFDEDNTGNYTGIGVQITELNDRITVTKVFRQTPADQAGLVEGDVIVGVNQHNATDWTTAMASDSIRGRAGTNVRVTIERPGFVRPLPFTLTRTQVHVPAVTADVIDGTKVGYVVLDRVARGAAEEVDSVLRQLDASDGLIIDLRRNPGGFLDESLMLSELFLSPGQKLASLQSRAVGKTDGSTEESWADRFPARIPDAPIIVLVDEYTASAAEIVTGALQDHDRALVMGQRTFGKGVVQSVLDLPYGHKLRITTGSWHTPLGRTLHRNRDEQGVPLAEDPESLPTVSTAAGRRLVAGGGIFPDVEMKDDTLKQKEREFLEQTAEKEIPLVVRLSEFSFDEAQQLRTAGQEPTLREASFTAFLDKLRSEGAPGELLDDPVVRDYLAWRLRGMVADRMDRPGSPTLGVSVRNRMERDPVLSEAVRLLQGARTQGDLYAAAASHRPARGSTGGTSEHR